MIELETEEERRFWKDCVLAAIMSGKYASRSSTTECPIEASDRAVLALREREPKGGSE